MTRSLLTVAATLLAAGLIFSAIFLWPVVRVMIGAAQ